MQNIQIDGANLLDGIVQNDKKQEAVHLGKAITSTTGKPGQIETWRPGERLTTVTYQRPEQENEGGTFEDIMEQAEDLNATLMKNEMVVAANTTSVSDVKKMDEDGFSLPATEVHTVVTETDKIKMQLAKAGVDISYFGDTLSKEQLEQMVGNSAVAQDLANKLQQADLPLTQDNLSEGEKAVGQAMELEPLSDGAIKYMLDNELEPTVANLYKARHSGSSVYVSQNGQADFSQMQEQMERIAAQSGRPDLQEAVSDAEWMVQNEIPVTPKTVEYIGQLKEFQAPENAGQAEGAVVEAIGEGKQPGDAVLIEERSLQAKLKEAVEVVKNATEEELAYVVSHNQDVTVENLKQARGQIAAGVITEEEKAQVTELVQSTKNLEADTGISSRGQAVQFTGVQITMITARRQLEEVRMEMTLEAASTMAKLGVSVDTEPMEELISQLKNLENQYYANLLEGAGIEATEANVAMYADTTEKLAQLKNMPVYALGIPEADVSTLGKLHEAGSGMQQNFKEANQRYETMQTKARPDLGDSLEKAFGNIDEILEDLDMAPSPANERAVRILAYNHTEITQKSVVQMKSADQQVQMAFKNLSPAVVREMIGRGINPLDMEITELNRTVEKLKEELQIDQAEDKYSEYLFKLEKNHNISQQERESYIGIYRLMHQISESDGAAVGALVNQGAKITMRNLMTAVRSEKRSGKMDVSVDGQYEKARLKDNSSSITNQIEAGYQAQCARQSLDELSPERLRTLMQQSEWEKMTPEQFLQQLQEAPEDETAEYEYYRQQLQELEQSAKQSRDVYRMLDRFDMPNTVTNVLAVSEWMQDRNSAYRRFFANTNRRKTDEDKSVENYKKTDEDGAESIDFEAVKEDLLERCSENLKKPEELAKAMEELAECAEHCTGSMLIESEDTHLDIRQLKLMNAQISFGAKMASDECFSLPIVVNGQVTNVTLKVVRGKEEKGLVNITMETERLGKIGAEIKAANDGVSAYVTTQMERTRDHLRAREQEIARVLQEELGEDVNVKTRIVTQKSMDLNRFMNTSGRNQQPETEQEREVQTKTLYAMAEGFIRVLQKLQ